MQDKIKIVNLINIKNDDIMLNFEETIKFGYNPSILFQNNQRLIIVK